MTGPVYLDHHATTPCDPRVVDAMVAVWRSGAANAASIHHLPGQKAAAQVSLGRERVARSIGAESSEIVFTSGATEANHLALLGVAEAHGRPGHLVVSAVEHRAVLEPARRLAARGWDLTIVAPDADGRVTPEAVAAALRDDTVLVSVQAANSEVGTIQPVAAIAAAAKARGALVHVDAAQAWASVPLDVHALGLDLLSLSAHKAYGPQGVGALWIRRRGPRVPILPIQVGGSQEDGLRAGTVPVALVAGMGVAAELVVADLADGGPARLAARRDRLRDALLALPGVTLRGPHHDRLPGNVHVTVAGVPSAMLLGALRRTIACSAGSACASGDARPSPVLLAMGVPEAEAGGALRFGLGRGTTDDEVDRACDAVARIVPDAIAAISGPRVG